MGTPERAQRSLQTWLAWIHELEAKGPAARPRHSAADVRKGGQRRGTRRHRRPVRRGQGPAPRLHRDPGRATWTRRSPSPAGARSRSGGGLCGDSAGREHCRVTSPDVRGLEEHLFRRESGRIVAALTRIFGVHNLALAEDVAQDAFCRALEVWKVRGVPDNPAAWLMTTAKNRALRRHAARAHRAHLRSRSWLACSMTGGRWRRCWRRRSRRRRSATSSCG